MVEEWPKIRSRRTTKISPWMDVIAREVEFAPGEPPQIYHAVRQKQPSAPTTMTASPFAATARCIATWIYDYDSEWWIAGLGGAIIGTVWNFVISAAFVWRQR